jgi:hypothetical protein
MAIADQPQEQFYWHRPLHVLFNSAFAGGLVMDRVEEPPVTTTPSNPFSWTHYDMPPLLFARLRPAH